MRRAEAWVSGEEVVAPAPPIQTPGVFVGGDLGTDMGSDMGSDIDGEPWTEYHELDDEDWGKLQPFLPGNMGGDRHQSAILQ